MVECQQDKIIKKLSFSTSHLLTSSQIITSVNSAVKELIENALDASAKRIDVKLEDSGLSKIEIRDDGIGVNADYVAVMAKPQFTSKIVNQEDIEHCGTYGFRGEALSALCAVSEVIVTTKTVTEEVSLTYSLDYGGNVTSNKPSASGQGTTICCQNLFKNFPVRKNFYSSGKRKKEDIKKCEEIIKFLAVLHPEVRFSLSNDGCLLWQKASELDVRAALVHAWGSSLLQQMEEHKLVDHQEDITVFAFLPKPSANNQFVTRKSPDACWIAVNKKLVVQKEIIKILSRGYNTGPGSQSKGRYPVCFIHLQLSPEKLDINLEPNKDRLLFHCKDSVISLITKLVHQAYGTKSYENISELPEVEKTLIEVGHKSNSSSKKTTCTLSELLPRTSKKSDSSSTLSKLPPRTSESEPVKSVENSPKLNQKLDKPIYEQSIFESVPKTKTINLTLDDSDDIFNEDDFEDYLLRINSHSEAFENTGNTSAINKDWNENENSLLCSDPENNVSFLQLGENISKMNVQNVKEGTKNSKDHCHTDDSVVKTGAGFDVISEERSYNFIKSPNQLSAGKGNLITSNPVVSAQGTEHAPTIFNETEAPHTNKGEVAVEYKSPDRPKESLPKVPTEKWSLGHLANHSAKKIEPLKLVSSVESRIDKRRASPQEQGNAMSSVKKKRVDPGQPRLYDIIASQPVRKPNSPFAFFCKDHRKTVVAANSGAKLSEITDILLKKYRELSPEEKERYKDLAEKDDSRYQTQIQKVNEPKVSGSSNQKPVKKNKKERTFWKEITIPFNLESLREKSVKKPSRIVSPNDLALVGQLVKSGSWIGLRGDSQVVTLNPFRMKEALLYYKLTDSHILDVQPLLTPTPLNKSAIGDNLWDVLMDLPADKKNLNGYLYIIDKRITSNGFSICRTSDREGVHIVDQNQSLPYYGISDLKEVLQCIQSGQTTLAKCRPLKVQHYLQGEAVRMVRQMPSKLNQIEMQELIEKSMTLPDNCNNCFHNKSFLHKLFDLNSVRDSD